MKSILSKIAFVFITMTASTALANEVMCDVLWQQDETDLQNLLKSGNQLAASLLATKATYVGFKDDNGKRKGRISIQGFDYELQDNGNLERSEFEYISKSKTNQNPIAIVNYGLIRVISSKMKKYKPPFSPEAFQSALSALKGSEYGNCAPAQFLVGTVYNDGWMQDDFVIEKDVAKAEQYFRKSALAGYPPAFTSYAYIISQTNPDTACALFDLADQPLYMRGGIDCPENNDLAYNVIKKFASNGNIKAAIQLQKKYVKENISDSANKYLLVAQQLNKSIGNSKISEYLKAYENITSVTNARAKVIDDIIEQNLIDLLNVFTELNTAGISTLKKNELNKKLISQIQIIEKRKPLVNLGSYIVDDVKTKQMYDLTPYGVSFMDKAQTELLTTDMSPVDFFLDLKEKAQRCKKCFTNQYEAYQIVLAESDCKTIIVNSKSFGKIFLNIEYVIKDKSIALDIASGKEIDVNGLLTKLSLQYHDEISPGSCYSTSYKDVLEIEMTIVK